MGPSEESKFDWCFDTGEQALDIAVITFPQAPPSILVLGERNIFCLTETGKLRYMKKLEYDPSCFHPYTSLSEGTINYMVGTYTKSLLIYQDVTLKWAAKMEHIPVQVQVANFKDLKSCTVTLSDSGHLECVYLGTDPAITVPPQVDSRELNYSKMDAEMAQLQRKIKEKGHKAVITPHRKTDEDLQLNVHISPNLDDMSLATGIDIPNEDSVPSVSIRIQLKSRLLIDNVKVEIHTPWPLATNQSDYIIPSIDFCKLQKRYGLVLKPVLPVKSAIHKLTIDTNKPPVNLNDIFPDLLGENAGGPGAALGFQFFGGPVVTVLASKTSLSRLNQHFNRGKYGDFKVSFDGSLPLQEYFELVDAHFECRMGASKCLDMLDQRASQFRVIQKRLLTRFKDKTPTPLQNLDTLLEGTFRQILALGDAVEQNQMAQAVSANNLSSGTYLLNFLIRLWTDMTDDEFKVLENSISPVISDSTEQGWQEMTDAAVTHLLRTVLAKSAKDAAVNPSPLAIPSDTGKVKKHIALLCDRLGKGARLVEGLSEKKERTIRMPTPQTIVEDQEDQSMSGDTTAVDNVLNTHYRDKSKKKKRHGKSRNVDDLAPLGLPVLDRPNAGLNELVDAKSQKIRSMVPDLDDMTMDDSPVVNGNKEQNGERADQPFAL
nr:hypothetical protein BaRGS_024685 [Batillaria attramentaria]